MVTHMQATRDLISVQAQLLDLILSFRIRRMRFVCSVVEHYSGHVGADVYFYKSYQDVVKYLWGFCAPFVAVVES